MSLVHSLLRAGMERFYLYMTLPSDSLKRRFSCYIAGIFNVLFALPSLVGYTIARLYDACCRFVAGKCLVNYMGFYVRSRDCEGLLVFHPSYEHRVTTVLASFLRRGSVFVDVGAHVGRYALLASKRVGSEGVVVALEPVTENYMVLVENVGRIGVDNVIALPIAAWSKITLLEFIVPPGRSGATAGGLRHFSGLQLRGYRVRVKAVDLDTLLLRMLKLPRVDVMKIDVEGAEVEVLEGAGEVVERHRPVIVVEVRPQTRLKVEKLLKLYGYRTAMIDQSNLLAYRS